MKLSTLLLIIGLINASAKSYSQITLHENKAALEKVLQKIESQAPFNFIYDENNLKTAPISVNVSNVSINKALDACFKDMPVTYSIVGHSIILKPSTPSILDKVKSFFEGPVQVKGRITDSTGAPLNRATVFFVKKQKPLPNGGEITYVTNENGLFYMDAEEGDELGVSYIGYQTYTFKVKRNMTFQNIVLHTVSARLKEVIVHTGYQNLSKERATGSFSKPDMKTFSTRSNTMDVIGRLDGQIPGLTVSQNVTVDRITHASTRSALIRGTSSTKLSTEPLYVVNGVIVTDFGSINVDDIEDITVLKDAAAAAIWGAQAANGVVVIVTKSGAKNQRLKVSYQGFVYYQGKPNLNYQRFLNSSQYIQAAKETFNPVKFPYGSLYYNQFIAPHEQILYDQNMGLLTAAQANAKLDSLSGINNKQQIKDLWMRNAFTTNHTLSASGGSNSYSFYTSLGYTDVQTNRLGDKNNTYRVDLNQNYTPNQRFAFSLNTSLVNTLTSSKNAMSIGADAIPYQLFKDANGNNINMPYLGGLSPQQRADYQQASGIDLQTYSPLDELNYGHSRSNTISVNMVANATVKLWKGLSYLGTYGYLVAPGTATGYDDHQEYALRRQLVSLTIPGTNGGPPTYLLPNTGGNYRSITSNQRNWTVRNQLVYTYSGRGGNDLISLQGGQEARESFSSSITTNLLGYDEDLQTYPLINYLTLSRGVPGTVTGYGYYSFQPFFPMEARTRFNSYFALGSYTFNRKYSVDASWRVDHSNLFGSDVSAQNKPVYSFGAKWNVTQEQFLKGVKWLNNLALRATYGITGNSPYVGAATTFDVLSDPTGNYLSYPLIAGKEYNISSTANRKLGWESTHTTNIGVDFGVFNSRLTGTIEYYHKNTTDLLGRVDLDPFTGQSSATSNIGNLTNNGINTGLNSVNIRTTNFTWSSGIVFAYNNNKLASYSAPQSYENNVYSRLSALYVIGKPMSPLYAYQYAGLDKVGDPQIKLANGTVTKDPQAPGVADLVYKGSIIPKINGGVSNTFRYKQFELTANMVYSLGAVMRRDVNQFYGGRLTVANSGLSGNVSSDFVNRWKQPGDEKITDIPAYVPDMFYNYSQRNTDFYTKADINVVSASYLKLRDASLAYNLNPSVTKWLKIESAVLRLQVSNILLWKANKYGIDPEYQSFQLGGRGTPLGQHAITIGANVNF
ncbi:SusC/RagA family TonB-linked outer membrane protein [Mucilaginibacter sp. RS28]|uniref:SusC/RagA family TonB-linked outer membrane protein n=1 Tax=Mucilaginibacter straminoryzae TaxID=2932774 RepID=A0A9X1X1W8_9SPHI|nr:SusC/RagA family TonB-linked outer membrane protein [Mucilaginibacter straminoryzae]MCJ8208835.1 SusC/RagA family TonB-linked outer membrane protein [Mucilaginibacter straminoryzae]